MRYFFPQKVTEKKRYGGLCIRVAHFRDPENNLIELYSELPKEKWDDDLIEEEKNAQKGK